MQVLLQYQSKSYYIIGQEVYYSIGRFITLSGSYYIIGRFLLHYRAVITVSGVYYIIGWYMAPQYKSLKGMNIEWKKAVRRTLNLPRMTRSKLIPLLAGNCSFQEQHERRCGALYASMMQSDNMLAYYMARRAMYNVLGILGMNRVILRHKFGVPRENGVFNYQYTVCEEDSGQT